MIQDFLQFAPTFESCVELRAFAKSFILTSGVKLLLLGRLGPVLDAHIYRVALKKTSYGVLAN